jgi:hypothetical protein
MGTAWDRTSAWPSAWSWDRTDVGEDVGDGIDERAHVSKHAEVASVLSTPFTEHRVGGYRATHAQPFFGPPEEAATLAETGVGRLRGCVCAGAAHVT